MPNRIANLNKLFLTVGLTAICCMLPILAQAETSAETATENPLVETAPSEAASVQSVAPAAERSADLPADQPVSDKSVSDKPAMAKPAPSIETPDAATQANLLSLEAFKALQLQLIEQQFRLLDTNHDGYLDSEERSLGLLRLQQQIQQQIPSTVPVMPSR